MVNNDELLFSETNEETPYEQLLHLLFSFNIENQTISTGNHMISSAIWNK